MPNSWAQSTTSHKSPWPDLIQTSWALHIKRIVESEMSRLPFKQRTGLIGTKTFDPEVPEEAEESSLSPAKNNNQNDVEIVEFMLKDPLNSQHYLSNHSRFLDSV